MRLLTLVLLLSFVLMVKQICEGCGQQQQCLAEHIRTCREFKDFINGGLKRRVDDAQHIRDERAAKQRRLEEEHARAREQRAKEEAQRAARVEVRL